MKTIFPIIFMAWAANLLSASPLQDIDWGEQNEKGLSRHALEALKIKEVEWKHAESEHFVYHFTQKWMAERASAECETYYAATKKDLKIEEDRWELKGQVFLFEQDLHWKEFVAKSGVDRWSGGVTIGNEIFLLSPPASSPFTGATMPHEMSHLIINRFVRGKIPVWLNEGFAEQQSRKHFVAYTRPKGFSTKLRPNVVSEKNYIPLEELTVAIDYPSDETKVYSFYTESLRLVQFLIEDHPKQDFLEFLQGMADGLKFDSAFEKTYGSKYSNMEVFEKKFKDIAISKIKMPEDADKQ